MANQEKVRVWWQHWSAVLILILIASLVIWAMLNLGPILKFWEDQRAASLANKRLEEVYKSDIYGGKTPDETVDLFIKSLEQGDMVLASKYFIFDKQQEWKMILDQYQKQGLIANFSLEVKNLRNVWKKVQTSDSETAEFDYTLNDKQISKAVFVRYPSKKWKIKEL